ncbi:MULTISPECIES: hypothetical protein [unclassified Nostoc]|nr:hypothetical protein [Nostoc sp. 'Peltigera membranacea cyanobiont' 232]
MRYANANATPVATTDSVALASDSLTPVAYSAGFTATQWLSYETG